MEKVKNLAGKEDDLMILIFSALGIWMAWLTVQYIWDKIRWSAERSTIIAKQESMESKLDYMIERVDLFLANELEQLKEIAKSRK